MSGDGDGANVARTKESRNSYEEETIHRNSEYRNWLPSLKRFHISISP